LLHNVVKRRNEFDSKSVPAPFKSPEYRSLNEKSRKRFEKIYHVRDGFARKIDCPPDCVLTKKQMADIAVDARCITDLMFARRVPEQYHLLICDALKNVP
jgi:hypothetical protein